MLDVTVLLFDDWHLSELRSPPLQVSRFFSVFQLTTLINLISSGSSNRELEQKKSCHEAIKASLQHHRTERHI